MFRPWQVRHCGAERTCAWSASLGIGGGRLDEWETNMRVRINARPIAPRIANFTPTLGASSLAELTLRGAHES